MPIIGNSIVATASASTTDIVKVQNTTFQYSTTRIQELEASEYTQVSIVSDASPSVEPFKAAMESMLQTVLDACQTSPKADNLLLRHTIFHNSVRENHGWKMLPNIDKSVYNNCLKIGGGTALFDAVLESVEVMADSGSKLTAAKFTVNGIIFIITDGEDNMSHIGPTSIKSKLLDIQQREQLESLITILVGVGCGDSKDGPQDSRERDLHGYLTDFKNNANITHFIPMKDASKSSLAKLAAFISKSISDQSQALSSGGPSKALTSGALTI